jgi:hypothetical protein
MLGRTMPVLPERNQLHDCVPDLHACGSEDLAILAKRGEDPDIGSNQRYIGMCPIELVGCYVPEPFPERFRLFSG